MADPLSDTCKAVENADLAVSEAVAGVRDHPTVAAAGTLSEIADQPPLAAIGAAVFAFGLASRDAGVTRTGLRMVLSHALATGVKTVVKRSIDRTRPDTALAHGYRAGAGAGDDHSHALSSFPSGHTAGAVALTEAAVSEYPVLATPLRAASGAVAIVQVLRSRHYVSDIVVGGAIGLAAEAVVGAALDAAWPHLEAAGRALSDS